MKPFIISALCIFLLLSACKKDVEPPPDVDLSNSMIGAWQYWQRDQTATLRYDDQYYYHEETTKYEGYNMLWLYADSTFLKIFKGDTTTGRWSVIKERFYYLVFKQSDTTYRQYIPTFKSDILKLNEGERVDNENGILIYTQVLKRVQ